MLSNKSLKLLENMYYCRIESSLIAVNTVNEWRQWNKIIVKKIYTICMLHHFAMFWLFNFSLNHITNHATLSEVFPTLYSLSILRFMCIFVSSSLRWHRTKHPWKTYSGSLTLLEAHGDFYLVCYVQLILSHISTQLWLQTFI